MKSNNSIRNLIKAKKNRNIFDLAQNSLSIINQEQNNLKQEKVIRSNKLISSDYCEWLVGSIIDAERPSNRSQQGYDLVDKNGKKYEVKSRQVESLNQHTVFHLKKESLKLKIDLICVLIKPNYKLLGIFSINHNNIKKIGMDEIKKFPDSKMGRINLIWNKKRRKIYEKKDLINWYFILEDK